VGGEGKTKKKGCVSAVRLHSAQKGKVRSLKIVCMTALCISEVFNLKTGS